MPVEGPITPAETGDGVSNATAEHNAKATSPAILPGLPLTRRTHTPGGVHMGCGLEDR